jgi:hypothetical protein
MNKERIDSYIKELPSIKKAKLVIKLLSIIDFWTL